VKNGTTDIGAASREIKEEELPIVKHLLARMASAIVVKPGNAAHRLTKAQVRDIFGASSPTGKMLAGRTMPSTWSSGKLDRDQDAFEEW